MERSILNSASIRSTIPTAVCESGISFSHRAGCIRHMRRPAGSGIPRQLGMLAPTVSGVVEHRAGGSVPPNGRSSWTYIQISRTVPYRCCPWPSAGTVVSSACRRSAAMTHGFDQAPQGSQQCTERSPASAMVESAIGTPSKA